MGWHVDEEIDLSRSTDLHKNFSLYWHIGGALHPRAISYFNATEIILNSTQCECQSKLLDQLAKVRENWSKLEVDKITRIALSCYVAACVAIVELATGLDANSAKEFLLHAEAYAVTATKSRSHATIVRDEDFVYRFETYPQYNLTAEQQKEYLRIYDQQIPAWFNELPEWERNHLKTILEPVRTGSVGINEILHLLPCQYRKLPGLANFYRNRFVLAGLDGYEIAHLDSYSSSVPIPIDVKDENDRRRLALQNVTQLLGEGQVLNERLLDYREHWRLMSHFQFPLLFASKLSPFKSGVPDPEKTSRVLGERSAIIEKFRGVSYDIAGSKAVLLPMDINHAVNRWRRSHFNALTHSEKRRSFGGDDAGLEEMMVLFLGDLARKAGIGLKSVDLQTTLNEFRSFLADSESKEKLVGKFGKRYSQLLMMIDAVEQYVRCGDKTSEDADLYRLALEKVASPGLRYGHCKSGKDREKMSDMYSAALFATYHDLRGENTDPSENVMPGFPMAPEIRQKFVDRYVLFFMSAHYQELANRNAPGCYAFKSLKEVLPSDIKTAIKAKLKATYGDSAKDLFQVYDAVSGMNKFVKGDLPVSAMRRRLMANLFPGKTLKQKVAGAGVKVALKYLRSPASDSPLHSPAASAASEAERPVGMPFGPGTPGSIDGSS